MFTFNLSSELTYWTADDEATNDLAAALPETADADRSQRIVERTERSLPKPNATTKEEPGDSQDTQNTYRDPGATVWLARTDQPFPGITLPLTGHYICTTSKGFRVPDGTLTLTRGPKGGTWWGHFRITFLEGPSGGSGSINKGHKRSYYGMCTMPREFLDDNGQFWRQYIPAGFKLRTLQTSEVDRRIGGITFDWRRSKSTGYNHNVCVTMDVGLKSRFKFKRVPGPGFETDLQSEWVAFRN